MSACCTPTEGLEGVFGGWAAKRDLRRYRRRGPIPSTRKLVEALRAAGVEGRTLLDIGGGVGAVQHELFAAGLASATQVDVSPHYLRASREEAARRGHEERVEYRRGDFLAVAPEVEPADLVTLDRVICCYPDMEGLVAASAARARRFYGVVYPRERVAARLLLAGGNLYWRLRGIPFRVIVYPTADVDAAIRRQGFTPRSRSETPIWQVWLYERSPT